MESIMMMQDHIECFLLLGITERQASIKIPSSPSYTVQPKISHDPPTLTLQFVVKFTHVVKIAIGTINIYQIKISPMRAEAKIVG